MSWKKKVPGTFGVTDHVFAGHQSEIERALELLQECTSQNVPLQDILDVAKKYLQTQTTNSIHIQQQLNRIKDRFEAWL